MLTQLSRSGMVLKTGFSNLKLEQVVRFYRRGSALAGTIEGGCLGLETHISLESNESEERIRELVRQSENSCFTMQSLVSPVPVNTRVTLNGKELAKA